MPFLVIEGPDGAGKTSLIKSLEAELKAAEVPVSVFQDPGTSWFGLKAREIMHDPQSEQLERETEILLMAAVKNELYVKHIHPALLRGEFVICDRYILSTFVYNGITRNMKARDLCDIMEKVSPPDPDLYIVLNATVEVLAERLKARGAPATRFENTGKLMRCSLAFWTASIWTEASVAVIDTSKADETDVLNTAKKILVRNFSLPFKVKEAEGA